MIRIRIKNLEGERKRELREEKIRHQKKKGQGESLSVDSTVHCPQWTVQSNGKECSSHSVEELSATKNKEWAPKSKAKN